MDILGRRDPIGRVVSSVVGGLSRLCGQAEKMLFGADGPAKGPVFLVGLPRAGTTLVYQAFCHHFQVSYPPMITNLLPFSPGLATWFLRRRMRSYRSDFVSRYGMSRGMASPGEGAMWNCWFEKNRHYAALADCPRSARRAVSAMGQIERLGGGPVVNKNLRHNQRLRPLAEIFPNAVFLVVLRDPKAVALSILRSRYQRFDDPQRWFSINPRHLPDLRDIQPAEQIALQIQGLLEDLAEDIRAVAPDRFRAMYYEDFCKRPTDTLEQVRIWLRDHDIELEVRRELPASFPISTGTTDRLDPIEIKELDEALSRNLRPEAIRLPCSFVGNTVDR